MELERVRKRQGRPERGRECGLLAAERVGLLAHQAGAGVLLRDDGGAMLSVIFIGAHMIEMPVRVDHDPHRLVGALGDLCHEPRHRSQFLGIDQQNAVGAGRDAHIEPHRPPIEAVDAAAELLALILAFAGRRPLRGRSRCRERQQCRREDKRFHRHPRSRAKRQQERFANVSLIPAAQGGINRALWARVLVCCSGLPSSRRTARGGVARSILPPSPQSGATATALRPIATR